MRNQLILFLASVQLCVAAVAASGQDLFPRIINGVDTEEFESVGIVGSLQRGGFCTGTLISSYHVLTAAHCAEVIPGQTSGTFEIAGEVYTTTRVIVHPDFNPRTLDNDIAILELSEPVADVSPARINRDAPQINDVLSIVGYGGGGDATTGDDGTFGQKRVGTTTIDVVEPSLIIWEFDDPEESNTAFGDSGGPGFLSVDGQFLVASVTSSGTEIDAGLGDIAFNTRVDAFADWIDSIIVDDAQDEDPSPPEDMNGSVDSSDEPAPGPEFTDVVDDFDIAVLLDILNELFDGIDWRPMQCAANDPDRDNHWVESDRGNKRPNRPFRGNRFGPASFSISGSTALRRDSRHADRHGGGRGSAGMVGRGRRP